MGQSRKGKSWSAQTSPGWVVSAVGLRQDGPAGIWAPVGEEDGLPGARPGGPLCISVLPAPSTGLAACKCLVGEDTHQALASQRGNSQQSGPAFHAPSWASSYESNKAFPAGGTGRCSKAQRTRRPSLPLACGPPRGGV